MSTVAKFEREIEDQKAEEEAFDPTAIPEKPESANDTQPGGNSSDYTAAAKEIEAIEREQAEIDRINAEAMEEKAPHRDTIASLRKKIRDEYSIEAKALSAILTKRKQERRMKERIAALDEPAKGQFEQLEMVL